MDGKDIEKIGFPFQPCTLILKNGIRIRLLH